AALADPEHAAGRALAHPRKHARAPQPLVGAGPPDARVPLRARRRGAVAATVGDGARRGALMLRATEALERRARLLAPARRLRCAVVAEAMERFAAGRALRVLDAGCGDGAFAESIARRHPAWTVVGADVGDELLERGRRGAARNVEFVHADLTEDLGTDVYDAVAAIECLEEIPDDTLAL